MTMTNHEDSQRLMAAKKVADGKHSDRASDPAVE